MLCSAFSDGSFIFTGAAAGKAGPSGTLLNSFRVGWKRKMARPVNTSAQKTKIGDIKGGKKAEALDTNTQKTGLNTVDTQKN